MPPSRPESSGRRRVPAGAVAGVLASAGDGRQGLEDDPVREGGRDVGAVVGRAHLDDVDADDGQLPADPAHAVEQLPGGETARLRRSRTRRVAGVADVDVDGEEDPLALVGRDGERLGEALLQPAGDDLGHLVGPHALAGHPVEGLRPRPVAAEPDLEEPVAAQRPGLDEPAHRLSVAPERAELDVAGVGVRIEVDHRHPTVAEDVGAPRGVGIGDRVVAAEDDGDGAGPGDPLDRSLEGRQGRLDVAGVHLDVAGVDDGEVTQCVGA